MFGFPLMNPSLFPSLISFIAFLSSLSLPPCTRVSPHITRTTYNSYSHKPLLHSTHIFSRRVGAFHWPLFSPVCDAFQYIKLHAKFNYVDKALVGIPHTTLPFCSNVHQEIIFHAQCCRNMGILTPLV